MNVYEIARGVTEKVSVGNEPRSWLRFLGREDD